MILAQLGGGGRHHQPRGPSCSSARWRWSEKTARQVLVPRSQVRYLDLDEPLEKNIADARAAGHTWLPVCRGSLDQVEGVVNVKDLFFLLANGELQSLGQVQRPVLFVPENVTLEQLLTEFRQRRRQIGGGGRRARRHRAASSPSPTSSPRWWATSRSWAGGWRR